MAYINQPEEGKSYMKRIGAYGLLLDERQNLAVIKTSTGYFLPGGGLEENETLEDCLVREFREEISMEIEIDRKISVLSYFFYSTTYDQHMKSEGHFYQCTYKRDLEMESEADHELLWLEQNQAKELLFLENQRAAVHQLNN
ncbi:MAG: NUDIX domain-containing protein [Clostridia bacterium]|nr:NUDIX domain-containing protein [Clostridia bacterium]